MPSPSAAVQQKKPLAPPSLFSPIYQQQHPTNDFHPPPPPPPSSTATTFPHLPFLPTQMNSLQTNLLLNSLLLRHFQQQRQQQHNPQPPQPPPTAGDTTTNTAPLLMNGHQPQPQQSPNCPATMATEFINQQQQTNNSTGNNLSADTASPLFSKTIDSLYNILSPNVILLPVACHSLPDEEHIQLLGMPQTVIPVAIHPQIVSQFPVRPLLLETGLSKLANVSASTIDGGLPPVVVGGIRTNNGKNCCQNNQQQKHQFHLPIAFRQTLFSQQHYRQQQQFLSSSAMQTTTTTSASTLPYETCSQKEKSQSVSVPHQTIHDNGGGGGETTTEYTIEPLDLSMSTAAAINSFAANAQLKPAGPRKRSMPLTHQQQEQQAQHEQKKVEKDQQKQSEQRHPNLNQSKRVKSADRENQSSLSTPSVPVGIGSIPTAGIPNQQMKPPPPIISAANLILPSSVVLNGTPAVAPAQPKKQFPCDLCNDVSFFTVDTLNGHKKFYCRNRPLSTTNETLINVSSSTLIVQPHHPPKMATAASKSQGQFAALNPRQQAHQHNPPIHLLCDICGFKAFTLRGLRSHLRLSHMQQPPRQKHSGNGNNDGIKAEKEDTNATDGFADAIAISSFARNKSPSSKLPVVIEAVIKKEENN